MEKVYKVSIFIFWILVVVIYPMLISIYVTLPLFVGFAGLMMVIGLDEDRYPYLIFPFLYMLNLEINLSLPIFLMPISVVIFYRYIKHKLAFLKLCSLCVSIATVILIDIIYFFLLASYDFLLQQSSVSYDSLLLFSVVYDIIAAVLI